MKYLKVRDEWLNDPERAQPDQDGWQPMPQMITGRYSAAVTFFNGRIFVMNGGEYNKQVKTVEVFTSDSYFKYTGDADWAPQGQWSVLSNLTYLCGWNHIRLGTSTCLYISGECRFGQAVE